MLQGWAGYHGNQARLFSRSWRYKLGVHRTAAKALPAQPLTAHVRGCVGMRISEEPGLWGKSPQGINVPSGSFLPSVPPDAPTFPEYLPWHLNTSRPCENQYYPAAISADSLKGCLNLLSVLPQASQVHGFQRAASSQCAQLDDCVSQPHHTQLEVCSQGPCAGSSFPGVVTPLRYWNL